MLDPNIGIELIQKQIETGNSILVKRPIQYDQYSTWELVTKNILIKIFGEQSPNVNAIVLVGKSGAFPRKTNEAWWDNHRYESLKTQLSKLTGLAELLETEKRLSNFEVTKDHQTKHDHTKIFLVHGRDESTLNLTARFIEQLDLSPIILREQPNMGRTIIEKFNDYADVGFAIVLLTPDDFGGLATDDVNTFQKRARQNVILEFGFFLGKLGRNRVCALYMGDLEIPSDYQGVLYIRLDEAGGWKLSLAKEIKAAGLRVDMNKAI